MKVQKQLFNALVLILALALSWAGGDRTGFAMVHHADGAATHNMLVVGEQTVYLSHLPMFQEDGKPPMPHRYQAILEVTFAKQGSDPQGDYAKDRQGHPTTKVYTLNPEQFVLPTLVSTDPKREPLRKFMGTIFRGHLEKPQKGEGLILRGVEVNVERVVYFREFDPKAKKPPRLEYLLFGKGEELFLAHLIAAPPDFDQILAVKATGHRFTAEELAKGLQVVFPKTTNALDKRLKEKQLVVGEIKAGDDLAPKEIQVEVNRELYFEEGELRVPPDFETTPEEKQAGFP